MEVRTLIEELQKYDAKMEVVILTRQQGILFAKSPELEKTSLKDKGASDTYSEELKSKMVLSLGYIH